MQLKVYRKDNRKREIGRWRRYLMRLGVATVLVVGAVVLYRFSGPALIAAASLRDFIIENPYFSVREIQVRGGEKISGNEIVTIAGLRQGMNIWKIDPVEIEAKIARHPWVRRVLVHREFPRRITIDVEERTPKAIVAVRKLYYVDSDGVLFKEVEAGDSMNFPMLTGLSAAQLMDPNQTMRKRIREAVHLNDLMVQRSYQPSELHFDTPDRLVVFTNQFPVALRMGWGNWEEKLVRMERLMTLWKGHEERLASLDMSFSDHVVARLRRAEN